MALTVQNRILNQFADSTTRYFYLYEPLPVLVTETDLTARELIVNIDLKNSETNVVEETLTEYATYDINPGQPINIDLMKIVQQAHNADVWKFSSISEILNGNDSIVSKYTYDLKFTTDSINPNEIVVSILPILGGRNFASFQPLVSNNFPINDFEKYGIDVSSRWKDYPTLSTQLLIPNSNTAKVNVTQNTNTEGHCPCGGMLYWKSRLGGWMQWGFDLKTEKSSRKYTNNIEVGMFETPRNQVGVEPFIPTNYSGVTYSNSVTLKSLSIITKELRALDSISQSPVCYYLATPTSRLELVRITGSTVPLSNQANGGDFSVSFGSISMTEFKTR